METRGGWGTITWDLEKVKALSDVELQECITLASRVMSEAEEEMVKARERFQDLAEYTDVLSRERKARHHKRLLAISQREDQYRELQGALTFPERRTYVD